MSFITYSLNFEGKKRRKHSFNCCSKISAGISEDCFCVNAFEAASRELRAGSFNAPFRDLICSLGWRCFVTLVWACLFLFFVSSVGNHFSLGALEIASSFVSWCNGLEKQNKGIAPFVKGYLVVTAGIDEGGLLPQRSCSSSNV